MDARDSLLESTHTKSSPQRDTTTMSFANSHASPITTHLNPSNLPVSKIQRAWDRRPQSPFSRRKVKVGKVWKRGGAVGGATAMPAFATGMFQFGGSAGLGGGDTPMKAVKKMRIGDGEVVKQMAREASPRNRRIVTRSNAVDEELLELSEEEGETAEVDEDIQVEIVNEDGSTEEIGVQEELAQEEWEDESVTEEDPDGWDATLMHLGETVDRPEAVAGQGDTARVPEETEGPVPIPAQDAPVPEVEKEEDEPMVAPELPRHEDHDDTVCGDEPTPNEQMRPSPVLLAQTGLIPEGFVSPAKGRRRRPISQVRQTNANRRRTLPVNFAAQIVQPVAAPVEGLVVETQEMSSDVVATHESAEGMEPKTMAEMDDTTPEEASAEPATNPSSTDASDISKTVEAEENTEEIQDEEMHGDDEWEDIEEDPTVANVMSRVEITPEPTEQAEWIDTVEYTPTTPAQASAPFSGTGEEQRPALLSPSKVPSSPVPSITGQHPRLPLRRSPRRQSTSPIRQSTILPSGERSHLIAFTPIKLPSYMSSAGLHSSPLPTDAALRASENDNEMSLPQLTRSSSAPPEEPQMSPRKPSQPRLSDDTALLQAFLNRAAASKNKGSSEIARRESLENRRNSDSVRQALASPANSVAPVSVLADLDPNSPSPRKQSAVVMFENDFLDNQKQQQEEDYDELAHPSPTKKSSRRSGRAKKKPDVLPTSTYSGPPKIAIRGSADSVVLKKTEAQELATMTRNNTRKNKGGSIMPRLRLTKMAKEENLGGGEEAEDVEMGSEKPGRRTVKWSETLVAFYQGDEEPEVSMMTDELNAPEPQAEEGAANEDSDMIGVPTAIPASETPSKPRLRRLKPPRTASMPGKAPPVQPDPEPLTEKKAKSTSAATKRRSRIATPAKPKGETAASLLPDDVMPEAEPVPTPAATKKTPAAAKKKVISKLPAPATVTTISLATGLAPGKENSLIASPPKKRAKAPGTPAPSAVPSANAFAPKLDFTKNAVCAGKPSLAAPPQMLQENAAAALTSQAKKSAGPTFFSGGIGEESAVRPSGGGREELPASLGSPAKKRTRRAVGY